MGVYPAITHPTSGRQGARSLRKLYIKFDSQLLALGTLKTAVFGLSKPYSPVPAGDRSRPVSVIRYSYEQGVMNANIALDVTYNGSVLLLEELGFVYITNILSLLKFSFRSHFINRNIRRIRML